GDLGGNPAAEGHAPATGKKLHMPLADLFDCGVVISCFERVGSADGDRSTVFVETLALNYDRAVIALHKEKTVATLPVPGPIDPDSVGARRGHADGLLENPGSAWQASASRKVRNFSGLGRGCP